MLFFSVILPRVLHWLIFFSIHDGTDLFELINDVVKILYMLNM